VPATLAESPDQNLSSRVTLRRMDERDAKQRQVIARLDGGAPATLLWGDQVTTEVAPGEHVLRTNNTLVWKKVPFTIGPGEHLEFELINAPGRLTLGFLALIGVAPLYLTVERRGKTS
jgi:hypothetical protein